MLPVDDGIRKLILQNVDSGSIKKVAVQNGMKTLLMDGIRNVFKDRTTLEEVLRVAKDETEVE